MLLTTDVPRLQAGDAAESLIFCGYCGGMFPREAGTTGEHFTTVSLRPRRVSPRCLPAVRALWHSVILRDALVAIARSPEPQP